MFAQAIYITPRGGSASTPLVVLAEDGKFNHPTKILEINEAIYLHQSLTRALKDHKIEVPT